MAAWAHMHGMGSRGSINSSRRFAFGISPNTGILMQLPNLSSMKISNSMGQRNHAKCNRLPNFMPGVGRHRGGGYGVRNVADGLQT